MNPSRIPRFSLTESLLAILLVMAAFQMANVQAFGLLSGGFASSWMGSLAIAVAGAAAAAVSWRRASPEEKREFISAWNWPLPWLLVAVMVWQIGSFPPMMHDSLSYRLPRVFLWLQDNSILIPEAPDSRMIEMPWGWELLALPFVALNGVDHVAFLNLLTWMAFVMLVHHWAASSGAGKWRARWLAFAFASTPFCLLQAVSTANDLLAAVLLLASLHFILQFGRAPHWGRVMLSLLAFMMACGVKPHFLVLGLGWGAWWLFDPAKPWRHTRPLPLIALSPLLVIVSPLPTFVSNYLGSNALLGGAMESGMKGGAPLIKMFAASLQFLTAQLQLPVVPGADGFSAMLQNLPACQWLQRQVMQFRPGVEAVAMIDDASFGLIHFGIIVMGVILGWRSGDRFTRWLTVTAAGGFLMAGAVVVPETIGRSFFGFGVLLLMPALRYFATRGGPRVPLLCAAAAAAGIAAMILNPSCPAWPSRRIEEIARNAGKSGLAGMLGRYHAYQERALTGAGMLEPVPAGATVAVLARGLTPLVALWTPDWRRNRIEFIHRLSARDFESRNYQWLIVAANSRETFPDRAEYYSNLGGWQVELAKDFLPTLSGGPERWTLYRKSAGNDSHPAHNASPHP